MSQHHPLSRGFALLAVCLTLGAQGPTETPKPPASHVRKFVRVPPSTTVIEEASVFCNAALQKESTEISRPGSENQDATTITTAVHTNGTRETGTMEAGDHIIQDARGELPNGVTFYVFQLDPKEALKLDLKCASEGKVWMQFIKPIKPDGMTPAFLKANMPPRALRSKRIEITNRMPGPYEVILGVYGFANHPFTLQIQREP